MSLWGKSTTVRKVDQKWLPEDSNEKLNTGTQKTVVGVDVPKI